MLQLRTRRRTSTSETKAKMHDFVKETHAFNLDLDAIKASKPNKRRDQGDDNQQYHKYIAAEMKAKGIQVGDGKRETFSLEDVRLFALWMVGFAKELGTEWERFVVELKPTGDDCDGDDEDDGESPFAIRRIGKKKNASSTTADLRALALEAIANEPLLFKKQDITSPTSVSSISIYEKEDKGDYFDNPAPMPREDSMTSPDCLDKAVDDEKTALQDAKSDVMSSAATDTTKDKDVVISHLLRPVSFHPPIYDYYTGSIAPKLEKKASTIKPTVATKETGETPRKASSVTIVDIPEEIDQTPREALSVTPIVTSEEINLASQKDSTIIFRDTVEEIDLTPRPLGFLGGEKEHKDDNTGDGQTKTFTRPLDTYRAIPAHTFTPSRLTTNNTTHLTLTPSYRDPPSRILKKSTHTFSQIVKITITLFIPSAKSVPIHKAAYMLGYHPSALLSHFRKYGIRAVSEWRWQPDVERMIQLFLGCEIEFGFAMPEEGQKEKTTLARDESGLSLNHISEEYPFRSPFSSAERLGRGPDTSLPTANSSAERIVVLPAKEGDERNHEMLCLMKSIPMVKKSGYCACGDWCFRSCVEVDFGKESTDMKDRSGEDDETRNKWPWQAGDVYSAWG